MKLELLPRTDLAVRALRHLADHSDSNSADIAAAIGTTPGFLTQVLRPLVESSVLSSTRGPTGGYRLRRPDMSMLEIIEIMEGPTDDGNCVLRGSTCDADQPCSLHDAWVQARQALMSRLADEPAIPLVFQERKS